MANTFNNAKASNIGTSDVIVYTSPIGTTAVIHGLYLSNKTVGDITVTVKVGTIILINSATIKAKSTLVFNKPINLLAAEELIVVSNTGASVDAFVSVLEIT